MRGFYYYMCWVLVTLGFWSFNSEFGIIIALFGILDAIIQFSCGIWKRLDNLIKLQEVKK